MKLKLQFYLLSLMIFLGLPMAQALAATTLQLTPALVKVKAGQKFNVAIKALPDREKAYTVSVMLNFPADLIRVDDWKYADGWLPLIKPGYDALDNNKGTMIRTAGYPQGFASDAKFGTITFLAKKDGAGVIRIGTESLALNKNNANTAAPGAPVKIEIEGSNLVEAATTGQPQPGNTAEQALNKSGKVILQLEQASVNKFKDLNTLVVFSDFSSKPTPVEMSFEILDSSGAVVHKDKDVTVIEGQKVYSKKFGNWPLAPGEYSLHLTALYNTNTRKEFSEPFEILVGEKNWKEFLPWVGVAVVIFAGSAFFIIRRRKKAA